ncbi:MAG: lipoprotein signal peptidase [Luteibaculaceae bacterium]
MNPTLKKSLLLIFIILLVDQVSKFWVKLGMYYDESIPVLGNWFFIHFIENPGMAFGLEFGGIWGKLALTFFRIILVSVGSFYLVTQVKKNAPKGFIYTISLVIAGAIGNIIDSVFYGKIFSNSSRFVKAEFLPDDGGYAPWFMGKVVDMFYFPIIETTLPNWVPIYGGEFFVFFRPVFNVADSAITVGVILLLIFQNKWFAAEPKEISETKEN